VRFIGDTGISPRTIHHLRDLGHDAIHVRERGLERATDTEICDFARSDDRVVLAFDLDFGAILALNLLTQPSVVIFRLSDETPASVNARLDLVIREQSATLQDGALILVEDSRYRVRTLPISG
jgi:predicted nuclease of predicted toxin-antitoxin system